MPTFTARHVREAFAAIRQHYIPDGFGPSTKWDIVDGATEERFPPKAVLFLAKNFAGDDSHSGGGGDRGTNNALRERGFSVVLKERLENSREVEDIEAVLASQADPTMKKQLVNARLGQGGFREALLEIWSGKCALTGLALEPVLRASHIKPWRDADNRERLDPANGLLLAASVDALFDRNLISFDDQGFLLVHSTVERSSLSRIGLQTGMRVALTDENRVYLRWHRAKCKTQGSLSLL
ncbi:HNH endonuclease [Sphingomonas bacterium]|uniref:HNH endonuclease n=1 Tax=Sphingomonas bacterium TaxID=1895847 RepID=UPI0015756F28|nr:HNH endonuclease [Sphingomonas bacterium]